MQPISMCCNACHACAGDPLSHGLHDHVDLTPCTLPAMLVQGNPLSHGLHDHVDLTPCALPAMLVQGTLSPTDFMTMWTSLPVAHSKASMLNPGQCHWTSLPSLDLTPHCTYLGLACTVLPVARVCTSMHNACECSTRSLAHGDEQHWVGGMQWQAAPSQKHAVICDTCCVRSVASSTRSVACSCKQHHVRSMQWHATPAVLDPPNPGRIYTFKCA
eukprot:scaffold30256_cov20-Tisochrysis_lutea.AAC.1